MEPMKLDVLFAFFSYGGNGGINMLLPEIQSWFHQLGLELRDDPRIGRFAHQRFGDVPLTMERNRAVATAKAGNFDVLVMVDSDNVPDLYVDCENTKPFFWSSFNFLYERRARDIPSVIAAPYCGPPPHPVNGGKENVYVFYSEDMETSDLESGFSFEAYPRQQAAAMTGIVPMAAGPTGCIMYSVDAFDLMPVRQMTHGELLDAFKGGLLTKERTLRLLNMQSWFFYEFTDMEQTQKASTEDVTNTREIQLAGVAKHGEPVSFCNWDAWAGHYKPKLVGKPAITTVKEINALYQEAVESHVERADEPEQLMELDLQSKGTMAPIEEEEEPFDPAPPSRVQIYDRIIASRKVRSVGNFTPDEHLQGLAFLVSAVAESRPGQPLRIVEVGSWVGESALAMHQALGPAGGTIFCVDTWEGTPTDWTSTLADTLGYEAIFQHFCDNVGDLLDTDIKACRGDSLSFASSMEPQDADIIFLDAGHDYESVKADIDAWLPHVSDNGVLCGHDYCISFEGVMKAVEELRVREEVDIKLIQGTTIWVLYKADIIKQKGEDIERGDTVDADQDRATSES